ncbi:hypothetical protein CRUP_022814 [Coryphaenoides rupestris]|nr:hypothetical protein CRUP_022814 [Coryphaenoides rupestris]
MTRLDDIAGRCDHWLGGQEPDGVEPGARGPDLRLLGHQGALTDLQFSPAGDLVATASEDATCISCYTDCGGSPVFVDFNSSGTCVAASGEDSTLRIWDLRTNKLTHLYQVHSAVVNCFSFHPSNNYLISGSSDGTVKMADLHEGHVMYTLHGHKGCVLTTVFSRSGEEFVTGGADGQVLVWRTNLDRGRYRDVLRGHGRRCAPDLSARLAHLHLGWLASAGPRPAP